MTVVLWVVGGWVAIAIPTALAFGRMARLGDERMAHLGNAPAGKAAPSRRAS